MSTYLQAPVDAVDYAFDFGTWLATGETVTAGTLTAPGMTVLASAPRVTTITTTTITGWVTGGTDGTDVTVTATATTSSGRTRALTITIGIRASGRLTPRAPFGATIAGVNALVPEATLLSAPTPGQYGVTTGQVDAWLDELSGRVAMRLDGWQVLPTIPVAPETTSDRDQAAAYARDVVQNGAASYLEAARHPERASVNTTTYAAVLWERFTAGLEDVAGFVARRLAKGDPTTGGDTAAGSSSSSVGAFPDPTFIDRQVGAYGYGSYR